MKVLRLGLIASVAFIAWGCQSQWKVHGGADACRQMCENWGLEFSAMVGVGDQESSTGPGATACVCEPKERAEKPSEPAATSENSAAAVAGAQAAIIVAQQEEAQRQSQASGTSK